MKTKIVYQLDSKGFYVGPTEAHESPLEPGVFMVPGGCIEKAPPKWKEGFSPCFNFESQKWEKIANERIVTTPAGVELISEEEAERLWRNAELLRADIEVNKLEDNGLDLF